MVVNASVCQVCFQYTTKPRGQRAAKAKWADAWPSVIWTILTSNEILNATTFMKIFANDLRQSWHHSQNIRALKWHEDMLARYHQPPHFRDVTAEWLRCQDLYRRNLSGDVRELGNQYCYPRIRCCLGCSMYVDHIGNEDEVKLIPLKNYLASLNVDFTSFSSTGDVYRGARRDWTLPVQDLEWVIQPALYTDKKMGLCIPMCSTKVHANATHKYMHLPRHPIVKTVVPQCQDVLAPAAVTSRYTKQGSSNQYNTSYPIFEQTGDSGGLSTGQLSCKRRTGRIPTDVARIYGFTLTQRPDILQYVQGSPDFQAHAIDDILYEYRSQPIPPDVIEEYASCGTYIDIMDAHHFAEAYNEQMGRREEQENEMQPDAQAPNRGPHHCLLIVHSNDQSGAQVFQIRRGQEQNHHLLNDCAFSMLNTLLHVRVLHRQFLTKLWGVDPLEGQTDIANVCVKLSQDRQLTVAELHNLNVITNRMNQHNDGNVDQSTASVLRNLCSNVMLLNDFFQQAIPHNVIVCILIRPDQGEDLPPFAGESEDATWELMYAQETVPGALDNSFVFRSRWNSQLHWQTAFGEQPERETFAIYVRREHVQDARAYIMRSCGGQSKVFCSHHRTPLLSTQYRKDVPCLFPNCTCSTRWQCGFQTDRGQCRSSLCRKHMKEIYEQNDQAEVYIDAGAAVIQPLPAADADDGDGNVSDEDGDENIDDIFNGQFVNPQAEANIEENDDDDDNNAHFYLPVDDLPSFLLPAESGLEENYIFTEDGSNYMLNHHLLNHSHLHLLHRRQRSRTAPLRAQRILQQICCRTPAWTIPLIAPEAHLFTIPFWCVSGASYVGALPSLMYSRYNLRQRRIGNIIDHLRIRVRDPSLVTSRIANQLQFYFDVNLNLDLNNNAASIVTRKGLEHLTRNQNIQQVDGKENILPMDDADSSQQIRRLAALQQQEGSWNLFVTLTCNDSATFGVAPIRKAIEAAYAPGRERDQALQSYSTILCRAWERTTRIVWNYILHSPELPLGRIRSGWMRYEFQSASSLGNKPHVHAGLIVEPGSLEHALSKIKCSLKDLFDEADGMSIRELTQDGFISHKDDFDNLYKLAKTLQMHSCENAGSRCQKKTKDDTYVCRVQRHPASFQFTFDDRTLVYDTITLCRLQALDLANFNPVSNQWRVHEHLQPGSWHYPALPGEHFIPTNSRLFTLMQSCTNVQFCDHRFNHAYLAKYAAGIEERPPVDVYMDQNKNVKINVRDLSHEKITGQKMKSDKQRQHLSRYIALTEMIWYLNNFPYVVTDRDMTHVCTLPPEYRPSVVKRRPGQARAPEGGGGEPLCVQRSRHLPMWRHFTASQSTTIAGIQKGSYSVDLTTAFSLRCPELIPVSTLAKYTRWFVIGKPLHLDNVPVEVASTPWIDGAGRHVKIRISHIEDVTEHFRNKAEEDHVAAHIYTDVMLPLIREFNDQADAAYSVFFLRFVDITTTSRNVVVFTQMTPDNPERFIIHVLLTMGSFDAQCVTELDLYGHEHLVDAFRAVQLLPADGQPDEEHVKHIARRYVLEQLHFMPIGVKKFARLLEMTIAVIANTLLGNGPLANRTLPRVLEDDIIRNVNEQFQQYCTDRRTQLVDSLSRMNIPQFPDMDILLQQRALDYRPQLIHVPPQSQNSYDEQCRALRIILDAIDQFPAHHKSLMLLGAPGAGKTFLAMTGVTYAVAKNMLCEVTSLTSHRARKLGGQHVHLMFELPCDDGHLNVKILTELSLFRLKRRPTKIAFLQRIQLLVIEEIGLLSAQTLAVIDNVLRNVRNNKCAFGGVLIIATGDPRQLSPIQGNAVWSSFHLLFSFTCLQLREYVRAAEDVDLQVLLQILRKDIISDDDERIVREIMTRRIFATNTVPSWDDVPDDYVRIVGTKRACNGILRNYLQSKIDDPLIHTVTVDADDYVEVAGGNSRPANETVRKLLDRYALEPRNLTLFDGAVVRFTFNNNIASAQMPIFSQGQLAVVTDLPNVHAENPKVHLRLIPNGYNHFDVLNPPADWQLVVLSKRNSPHINVNKTQTRAWRHQFAIINYVTLTIHRALGDTCPRVATQISSAHAEYRLWEREQLLVLFSRTHTLNGLLLVTADHNDTMDAIANILHQRSPWALRIETILDVMEQQVVRPRIVAIAGAPEIPDIDAGYVYMLVSTKVPQYAYVGESKNIKHRLAEHNRGQGAIFTRDPYLRPWQVHVLITNFPGDADSPENIDARKQLERSWHERIREGHDAARRHIPDARIIYDLGQQVFIVKQNMIPALLWTEFNILEYVPHDQ